METIARVRREQARGKSIRAIARDLRLSRDTVAKYLPSGETEAKVQSDIANLIRNSGRSWLIWKTFSEHDGRHLGGIGWISGSYSRALRRAGYAGGYDAVRRYARRWADIRTTKTEAKASEAFIPLTFPPAQEPTSSIGRRNRDHPRRHRLQSSSPPRPALPQPHALHPGVSAAEPGDDVRRPCPGLCFLGQRTCERGIYDNMKTAVDAVFVGKERKFNRRFAQMCSHYLVEPTACTPAAGWEKGQVENQVGSLRQRLFIPRPHVKTLEELNRRLEDGCIAYAGESRHPDDRMSRAHCVGGVRGGAPRRLCQSAGPSTDSARWMRLLEDLSGPLRSQPLQH